MVAVLIIWVILTVLYLFSIMANLLDSNGVWHIEIFEEEVEKVAKHNGTVILMWLFVIPFGFLFLIAGIIRWCFKEVD